METSIARRIRQLVEEAGDRPVYRHVAIGDEEPAFGWRWLDDRSSRLAGALAERGLAVGDTLAIGLRNSPELLLATLAAWKLGAVPVPVRWDVPAWELDRLLEVIAPRVHLAATDVGWIDATAGREAPALPDVVSPQMYGICSSGATGTPKVILKERRGIYEPDSGKPMLEAWRPVRRPQTILVPAPMYHTNGFATLLCLLAGDHLVVLEKFDPARVVDVVERHRVTHFTATPTMLQRIASLPGIESRDLSSLEWILQGAAPMPPSLVRRWAELIGAERIVMAYGMTEGFGLTAIRADEWMAHEGSVGRGFGGTEIRILDERGRDLPPREIGEIHLRSSVLGPSRYVGNVPPPRGTDDGFYTAGDLGHLDEDGYLYVVDRRVDMIVTGGANVFPAEVEAALADHPKIADVVVIGLRDAEWGRRVHAVVEPKDPADPPTAAEVVAWAKSRLAPYKVPKTVELVGAVPRSEATKVNRRRLVEERGG